MVKQLNFSATTEILVRVYQLLYTERATTTLFRGYLKLYLTKLKAVFLGRVLLLYLDGAELISRELDLPENWCLSGNKQKLLTGDWNGDSFTDLLCHNQTGEMKILLNTKGNLYEALHL